MNIAVLGAGGGGLSAVVELCRTGHDVVLWNRNPDRLAPHRADGVRYRGVWGEGTVRPAGITADLARAIDGVDAVVACLPSVVHSALFADLAAARCAVPIILNPGHTGGALHLRQVFASQGTALPAVVEFATLAYVARVADGVVNTTGRAHRVNAAALPGGADALTLAGELFPGVTALPDVLASSLSNVNLVLHPPGATLAAAWVEATAGAFRFYVDAMTPGVARVLAALDEERLAVARAFGHTLPNLLAEMAEIGTADPVAAAAGDIVGAVRGGVANSSIAAPDSFAHRYYQEDFAFGLMPFIALGELAGVAVPVADALLKLGSLLAGPEVMARGLSAQRLGIAGSSAAQLIASVRS